MSNGSESTPERCVHAVDGPDWAGLRELYPDGFAGESVGDAADALITDPLLARIHELEAERDVLQGRLDAMTVEWAVHWIPGDTYHDAPTEADAVSLAGEFVRSKAQAVQRLVGPWTVVPEGEQP